MSRRLAIALVHHPVLAKGGEIVTTALTNLDVHDLARSARTYGCTDYFVVHPIALQRELVTKIVSHWTFGSSAQRIPDRKEALSVVRPVQSLEDAVCALAGAGDERVTVWVTAARDVGKTIDFAAARRALEEPGGPVLLVFGTGWGLAPSVIASADAVLAPIRGPAAWNHLSVRAACAIALDRLRAC
ncbi:MAG: RNA methyltransferase [Polyangiaceae bacterium]|nr:RNA methyltransferase [Polyangiaceae bacterium]